MARFAGAPEQVMLKTIGEVAREYGLAKDSFSSEMIPVVYSADGIKMTVYSFHSPPRLSVSIKETGWKGIALEVKVALRQRLPTVPPTTEGQAGGRP